MKKSVNGVKIVLAQCSDEVESMEKNLTDRRQRLFEIVEVGAAKDRLSRGYDFLSTVILIFNIIITVMNTFECYRSTIGDQLRILEGWTIAFFAVDYILRLFTAGVRYSHMQEGKALLKYVFSMVGIIDLLSFLPHYLPFVFPSGTAVFRMFRVIRIFRLFRLNAYYDSLNVITDVIYSRKQQLLSSVFIIMILMLASSLCMYSLEHDAQPDVFANAFSGIWWSVSTLLTVGYGDIYPITVMGRIFGIVIAFLGVGMVAIPTGIISAGFVERYAVLQNADRMSQFFAGNAEIKVEHAMQMYEIFIGDRHPWCSKRISETSLAEEKILIQRNNQIVIPTPDFALKAGDLILLEERNL